MKKITILIISILVISCSQQEKRLTLREVDITNKRKQDTNTFSKPKSDEEVRRAYAEYLKYSAKGDRARSDAIARLAELEFELGNRAAMEKENLAKGGSEEMDDKLYNARLGIKPSNCWKPLAGNTLNRKKTTRYSITWPMHMIKRACTSNPRWH